MARKGVKHYRKAMSFCTHKWDYKTNQPKESEFSVDNVIDYAHFNIYKVLITNKQKFEDEDSNSKGEEIVSENEKEDIDTITEPTKEPPTSLTETMNDISENSDATTKEKVISLNENIDDEIYSDYSDEDDPVPSNYMFLLLFVLILWGSFTDVEDRLTLLLADESNQSKKDSIIAQKR